MSGVIFNQIAIIGVGLIGGSIARGALDGVPASIKDLVLTRGWPTLRGSHTVGGRGNLHF